MPIGAANVRRRVAAHRLKRPEATPLFQVDRAFGLRSFGNAAAFIRPRIERAFLDPLFKVSNHARR